MRVWIAGLVLMVVGPSCGHRVASTPQRIIPAQRITFEPQLSDQVWVCVRLPYQADLPYEDAGMSCVPLGDLRRWISAQRNANEVDDVEAGSPTSNPPASSPMLGKGFHINP